MKGFDGNPGILGTEFEQVDDPSRLQGGMDRSEHFGGVGKFVIGIHENGGIDGVGGEIDGFDGAQVRNDICKPMFFGFVFQEAEHLGFDIDGDDLSLGDAGSDTEAVVAGAGADVRDDCMGREVEECDGFGWGFFFFPIGTLQPPDAGMAHDLGDFTTHENFANAIG